MRRLVLWKGWWPPTWAHAGAEAYGSGRKLGRGAMGLGWLLTEPASLKGRPFQAEPSGRGYR